MKPSWHQCAQIYPRNPIWCGKYLDILMWKSFSYPCSWYQYLPCCWKLILPLLFRIPVKSTTCNNFKSCQSNSCHGGHHQSYHQTGMDDQLFQQILSIESKFWWLLNPCISVASMCQGIFAMILIILIHFLGRDSTRGECRYQLIWYWRPDI